MARLRLKASPWQSSFFTSFRTKTGGGGGSRTRIHDFDDRHNFLVNTRYYKTFFQLSIWLQSIKVQPSSAKFTLNGESLAKVVKENRISTVRFKKTGNLIMGFPVFFWIGTTGYNAAICHELNRCAEIALRSRAVCTFIDRSILPS